jgi:autotransporter-associated beta strand protein
MRVPAGGTCKLQGVKGNIRYGWGGNYQIGDGALMSFFGLALQTYRIYANISGTGKLEFPVNTGVNPPSKQNDYLYGDLSAFTGVIEAGATGSGTKPILAFATAKSFPGDMAAKTEQGLSVANGVKLAFAASGSIDPNRGVFFGTGTQTVVDVVAGETVVISSDISGTSGFEKTGAGTLVLTGNLKGLSGTVKVSEGTLSLPCESRCRTFTLDVAEGATVTHAPPPGLMLFVR